MDIKLDNEYVLVYNGTKLIVGLSHTGEISTPAINTVETFENLQLAVDRAIELNLEYSVDDVVNVAQAGATLPQSVIDWVYTQDSDYTQTELDEIFN